MIWDLGTMQENRRKDRRSGHDAGELSKIKGIRARCRRAAGMKGDLSTMPKSCQKIKSQTTQRDGVCPSLASRKYQ